MMEKEVDELEEEETLMPVVEQSRGEMEIKITYCVE
jgi:hypothetical protein